MGDDDLLTSYHFLSWPVLRFWRWKLGLWLGVIKGKLMARITFPTGFDREKKNHGSRVHF